MSFDVVGFFAVTVAGALMLLPLKELKPSYFFIALCALSLLVMNFALVKARPIFSYLNYLISGDNSYYFKIMMKATGISLITSMVSDLTGELGMNSLSGKVEFTGKVFIIILTLPLFDELLALAVSLV